VAFTDRLFENFENVVLSRCTHGLLMHRAECIHNRQKSAKNRRESAKSAKISQNRSESAKIGQNRNSAFLALEGVSIALAGVVSAGKPS